MKKTLQRLGIVTVGLSLCLWSCREQDGLVKPEDATSISPKIKEKIDFSVVEGRLKFETDNDFDSAFGKSATEQGREEFESSVGFTSYNEVYEEFVKNNLEKNIDENYKGIAKIVIDSDGKKSYAKALIFNSITPLLNRNGLVQVGEKIIKFSDDVVKIANIKYIAELESDITSPHVVVNKIIKKEITEANKSVKSAKVKDYFWEVYDWWHYPRPSWAADRRVESRRYAATANVGQYYIWEFGFTIQNQRDDFWGWEACNLEGWKRGAGYGSIVPNGAGSQVASNQIYPNQNMSWGSDTYSGVHDYHIILNGRAYPTKHEAFTKLGLLVTFRPGILIAQEFSTDNNITYLSFDTDL